MAGLAWRGEYDPRYLYAAGEIVRFKGCACEALRDVSGIAPRIDRDTADWRRLMQEHPAPGHLAVFAEGHVVSVTIHGESFLISSTDASALAKELAKAAKQAKGAKRNA